MNALNSRRAADMQRLKQRGTESKGKAAKPLLELLKSNPSVVIRNGCCSTFRPSGLQSKLELVRFQEKE